MFEKKSPRRDRNICTPFRDKARDHSTERVTGAELRKRTRCYRCRQLGHMARVSESSSGLDRRDGGTVLFFTTWSTPLIGTLAKVDRKKAEQINQELQKKLCQTFQTEAAIDLACDQDRVLREHFPQTARSQRKEILPPDLEEICGPRHLDQEEDEDDETETARPLSEREKRELFRQHRNLGHPQPTELACALRHAGAKREAIRFVLKELRCPTCEARPPPLPPRPGMLPRCLRLNQCIGVDLVDLEVRDGTSAAALNVVCWGTGLQIVQPLWTSYTAKTVMKEFKIAWVKHYGWPEIVVHDQGLEFMGTEFQNLAGAAGVLTMPIDSQSPWQNGKTERAGQSFKHQLWDLDEECHIEGETECEAAVAECCGARNRYCNRSGFTAHQRVSGSSLRFPGSLLSDDPIDRQLLTADPYTHFQRANEMRTAAQRALFKQNSARAVQAAGLARHRSQPGENKYAEDTTMVWRNNKLTGRKGWTGPSVVVAVSPTRTYFWSSMRGCLLKCSSEQVRKATEAEWLGERQRPRRKTSCNYGSSAVSSTSALENSRTDNRDIPCSATVESPWSNKQFEPASPPQRGSEPARPAQQGRRPPCEATGECLWSDERSGP